MPYEINTYDFIAYPGATAQTDTPPFSVLPDFALMGGKSQYVVTIDAIGGTDDFVDKNFYFNPALFKPQTIPTPDPTSSLQGFFANTAGLTPGATVYPMTLITLPNPENVRNFNASFVYVSTTQIIITFDFYFIYDIADFITGGLQDNSKKFRSNTKLTIPPTNGITNNTANSVYNSPATPKAMWFYLYVKDNTSSAYVVTYMKPGDIKARFYNKGIDNAIPDNPLTVPVSLKVNASVATAIATNADTEVEWNFNSVVSPAKVFGVLYRSDDIDASLNYVDDVILGYGAIVTAGGVATIDGLIKEPSEKSFAAGITTVKFNIDSIGIVANAKYFIAILIYDTASTEYTVQISPEFTTFAAPPAAIYPDLISDGLMDYTGDIANANIEWGPSLKVAMQERIRSRARFDTADYDTKVVAQYGGGTYNSQLKNVTLKITDAVTLELLYTKDLSNGVIRTDGAGYSEYTHEFRIRHDEALSWEGRTLKIEWIQEFFYSIAFTGLTQDHTDFVVLEQAIEVRYYENNTPDTIQGVNSINLYTCDSSFPPTHVNTQVFSFCDLDCLQVCFSRANNSQNSKIIVYIDNRFYSANSIKEEEVFTGNLAQQLNDILYDVPEDFTTFTTQCFKIDPAMITNDIQYRVSITVKFYDDIAV